MPSNGRWRPRSAVIQTAGRVALWALAAVGVLVVLAGAVWLVWKVPPALYSYVPDPKDRAGAESSTRTGLIAGLAGLAALGSLTVTARTYRLSLQGQLTNRYTTAVTQLGDNKLDIRLGGIYALERLAVDSRRDHPTVVEVLSAYVRERTSMRIPREPLPVDVQAALTVLGRLPRRDEVRADLEGADLTGADLYEANLTFGRLGRADLTGADLSRADLTWIYLYRADLTGASFDEAILSRAYLAEAILIGAYLRKANLAEAHLDKADLTGAILKDTDLTGANLREADLVGAYLGGADLTGADLREADLTGAYLIDVPALVLGLDLRPADLTGADLRDADLTGALLLRVDLTGALLGGVDLTGADLSGANLAKTIGLAQSQLDRADGDEHTRLPTGLQRPVPWHSWAGDTGPPSSALTQAATPARRC